MENIKTLTQELNVIDELLQLVNTKEEFDYLIAQAKQICPFWTTPAERERLELFFLFSSSLKGGVQYQ